MSSWQIITFAHDGSLAEPGLHDARLLGVEVLSEGVHLQVSDFRGDELVLRFPKSALFFGSGLCLPVIIGACELIESVGHAEVAESLGKSVLAYSGNARLLLISNVYGDPIIVSWSGEPSDVFWRKVT